MPKAANLSPTQRKAAIPILESMIKELDRMKMDVRAIQDGNDPGLVSLQERVRDTLRNIFGDDAITFKQYKIPDLAIKALSNQGPPLSRVKKEIQGKINGTMFILSAIIRECK